MVARVDGHGGARTLADLDAVEVDLDGPTGYLLPDDLEAPDPIEPWAALLPALDPTTMGWIERGWYLGPHKELIFEQRQRRRHGVVGRANRGRLASERHRRGRAPDARGRRRRGTARRRARSGAPVGVAGPAGAAEVPLPDVEGVSAVRARARATGRCRRRELQVRLTASRPLSWTTSSHPPVHSTNGRHASAVRASSPSRPQSLLASRTGRARRRRSAAARQLRPAHPVVVGRADDGAVGE